MPLSQNQARSTPVSLPDLAPPLPPRPISNSPCSILPATVSTRQSFVFVPSPAKRNSSPNSKPNSPRSRPRWLRDPLPPPTKFAASPEPAKRSKKSAPAPISQARPFSKWARPSSRLDAMTKPASSFAKSPSTELLTSPVPPNSRSSLPSPSKGVPQMPIAWLKNIKKIIPPKKVSQDWSITSWAAHFWRMAITNRPSND